MNTEAKEEVTNQDPVTPEVGAQPTNPGETVPEVTPDKSVETPSEPMHKIVVDGREEELPLSKVIAYAQQGRHFAQEKGEFNKRVEETANKRFEAWLQEVEMEKQRLEAEKKSEADRAAYEELSPEEKLARDVEFLKQKTEESEKQKQQAEQEKLISEKETEIEETLNAAKKDYPLMDEDKILAILQATDKFNLADIKSLAKRTHEQELKRQADWEKEYLKKSKMRNKAGAEGSGGGTLPLAPTKLKLGDNTRQAVADFWARNTGK